MVRGVALLVGLLAAVPAMAGDMSAEEARRFVIGKMFSYTCFEGTRGQGRVHADGSVVGSIQFQGGGPVRYAALPRGGSHVDLRRLSVARNAGRALLQPGAYRHQQLPRLRLGAGFCLLRVHPQSSPAARDPQHAQRRSSAAAAVALRQQQLAKNINSALMTGRGLQCA